MKEKAGTQEIYKRRGEKGKVCGKGGLKASGKEQI